MESKELRGFLILLSNQLELLHLDLRNQSSVVSTLKAPLEESISASEEVIQALKAVLKVHDLSKLQP